MTQETAASFVPWLRDLAKKGGKGVVNRIDARCLGRLADAIEHLSARPASAGVEAKCTCGQAGHGNGHDPDCPQSNYSGPVKSERQAALSDRAGSKPEGDGCPKCPDYVGKCPYCGRPRPRPTPPQSDATTAAMGTTSCGD